SERGWRRLWVAAVPLALYAAWWLWALKFDQGFATAENVLLTPSYAADSLAAAVAALTGLGIDLTEGIRPPTSPLPIGWGRVLAAVGIGLLVFGVRRTGSSTLLWGAAGLLFTLWIAGAVGYEGTVERSPDLPRFAYPIVIGLVLALAASFEGSVPSRRVLLGVFGLFAFALPANLWQMRDLGAFERTKSASSRAALAMIELERGVVARPGFDQLAVVKLPLPGSVYLDAVDRFGSIAYSAEELGAASEAVRLEADAALSKIVAPRIAPIDPKGLRCGGGGTEIEVPPGEAVLRSTSGGEVSLRRFADEPTIGIGALGPGGAGRIELPLDGASRPWIASVSAGTLEICAVNSAKGS
ncbi:MAG: hypothetical protein WBC01_05985, partial [Solirubrobacterales bacterium]